MASAAPTMTASPRRFVYGRGGREGRPGVGAQKGRFMMNSSARKALIIGCGVAGPVVALFLRKAGIEAEIYEARAESTDYGGSFLNMACNGLGVLGTLGLDT